MAVYSTSPNLWFADTDAEKPTSNIPPGVILVAVDNNKVYQALNSTTWQQLYSSSGGGGGGGGVESVSGTAPIASSGGATPAISLNDGGVTLAKMANLAANSFLGNNTGSAATPIALTVAQAKALLALVKADVGLGNVDNTTDASKPVSTATQTALNAKARSAYNTSVANQGPGFATDTYLTGSSIAIPASSLQAKSIYRCRIALTKTAAGTATPIINVRFGVNGTTGDTSRGTLTFSAQTAVADEATIEFVAVFRTVGSGTSAVLQSSGQIRHRLSITGFGTGVSEPEAATSGGFDSTVANSIIGLSVNGGASAAWTVTQVVAELINLV